MLLNDKGKIRLLIIIMHVVDCYKASCSLLQSKLFVIAMLQVVHYCNVASCILLQCCMLFIITKHCDISKLT